MIDYYDYLLSTDDYSAHMQLFYQGDFVTKFYMSATMSQIHSRIQEHQIDLIRNKELNSIYASHDGTRYQVLGVFGEYVLLKRTYISHSGNPDLRGVSLDNFIRDFTKVVTDK